MSPACKLIFNVFQFLIQINCCTMVVFMKCFYALQFAQKTVHTINLIDKIHFMHLQQLFSFRAIH